MQPRSDTSTFFFAVRPVLIVGLLWSALSVWLQLRGHVPSGPVFVAPRNIYYAAQAAFALPVLLAQFWLLRAVAAVAAGVASSALPTRQLAFSFALPLGATWLLPDICAFALGGFSAMAQVVRIAAPVTALLTVGLVLRSLKRALTISWARAAGAALLGCFAQALLGGLLLR